MGLVRFFSTEPAFVWAQAIAFKVFVTLLPLILLATGVFGLVLRQDDPFEAVASFLRSFLPAGQSDSLVELVFSLQAASGALTFVGGGALIVTVVTLFSTLRYVVGAAMGESRHRMRSIVRGYLFDIRMALQVGTLFLLSFGVTLAVSLIGARSGVVASTFGLDPAAVSTAASGAIRFVGFVVPYVLTVGMLAQLFYFVPRPHAPAASAFWGAALAAVLFEAAKRGFTYYATYVADFGRYADQADSLGGLGGVFGLILAFVFWVYISGLILVVGAAVSALHEKRHRPRLATLRRVWSRMNNLRRHRRRIRAEGDAADAEAPADTEPDAADAEADAADAEAPVDVEAPGGDGVAASAVPPPERPSVSEPGDPASGASRGPA